MQDLEISKYSFRAFAATSIPKTKREGQAANFYFFVY